MTSWVEVLAGVSSVCFSQLECACSQSLPSWFSYLEEKGLMVSISVWHLGIEIHYCQEQQKTLWTSLGIAGRLEVPELGFWHLLAWRTLQKLSRMREHHQRQLKGKKISFQSDA
jgi:hypothetical protein